MRVLLSGFHLVIGSALLFLGVSVLDDFWKAPAMILLAGSVLMVAIAVGVLTNARWVKWLLVPLLLLETLIALFLLAGSIIWPESATWIVLLGYGFLVIPEILTWRQLGRAPKV